MGPRRSFGTGLLPAWCAFAKVCIVLGACCSGQSAGGGSGSPPEDTGNSGGSATVPGENTTAAICSIDGNSSSLTWDRTSDPTYVVVTTNGCPNHKIVNNVGGNPNSALVTDSVWYLPKAVVFRDESNGVNNNTVASRGAIGVALSGVSFFGPEDANGLDAGNNEAETFDWNGGHANPEGQYHYHLDPWAVEKNGTSPGNGHSPLVGFMADGIPIYGIYSDNGSQPTGLDACGGHAGVDAVQHYHYHFLGAPGPWPQYSNGTNVTGFPYSPKCLRGCVPDTQSSLQMEDYATCIASATVGNSSGSAKSLSTTITYSYPTSTGNSSTSLINSTSPTPSTSGNSSTPSPTGNSPTPSASANTSSQATSGTRSIRGSTGRGWLALVGAMPLATYILFHGIFAAI